MKNRFLVISVLLIVFGCTVKKESVQTNDPFWNQHKMKTHLSNRQDTGKWDLKMLENDLQYVGIELNLPFKSGVFPVPKYDLLGKESFKGVGNFGFSGRDGNELHIQGKTILYNSFFAGQSLINKQYTGNRKNEIFFQIIILTDSVDTLNYSHLYSEVVSRNHPDYICQGFYRTKKNEIDYMAFITADRMSFAIVNLRLFNLNFGKTILIAPQKDRSLRSMQIRSPELSTDEVENYTRELLQDKKIIDFFTQDGNI